MADKKRLDPIDVHALAREIFIAFEASNMAGLKSPEDLAERAFEHARAFVKKKTETTEEFFAV